MTRRSDYFWRSMMVPFAILVSLTCAEQGLAVPFVYRFDGTGTGTLDVFSFTNAAFSINAFADTADVRGLPGFFEVWNSSTTIDIGFAHGTFLVPTRLFVNQFIPALGLSRGIDLLDINNAAFATYDLKTAIGPVFDATPFAVEQFNKEALDIGVFTFTSARRT